MRIIDADALVSKCGDYYVEEGPEDGFIGTLKCLVDMQPTAGGWINDYEWVCPACGSSILVKTSKQSKMIGMNLSECPVCGKEVLYGKAD